MTLVLAVLFVATLLELAMELLAGVWRFRKYLTPVIIFGVAFGSGGMFTGKPTVITSLLLLVGIYRVFNVLRVVEDRAKEQYLRRTTRLTSVWLIGLQLLLAGVWKLQQVVQLHKGYWVVLAVLQLITASILAASTYRTFQKTRPFAVKSSFADRDLPTVTVAIPARNEDEQLEECLRTVLANDYPKLEVIVLDDCSQDRTSQIIRNFAHDGVRFIPGYAPAENWLAKNQAYAQLATEASGEFLLFCGVDVRFGPQSIRQLVTLLSAKHKRMLSLTPVNESPGLSFSQAIRYYWELTLPRRLFNRPPVMSSCWLIESKLLTQSGGFAAISNSITPEAYFAREAVKHDAYTFIRSTVHLGVLSVKSGREQKETAIRIRYPQLHRRPELVLLTAAAESLLLFAPYLMMIIGFWGEFDPIAEALLIVTCIILTLTYRSVTLATSPLNRWYTAPLFPITILVDVLLLNYSMGKYEFSTVEWKGRNVCIPVMQVHPHLPKLS
jgi:chlorobactene glucosyltransferase